MRANRVDQRRHLPQVPPAAQPRCLDLPGAEHLAKAALPLSDETRSKVVAVIATALVNRPKLPEL
ncbi:hypothetical protein FHT86_001521 [Rhizobium sp. BK313]|uniref:hypothetical protein n=1 Tax=Rhizobium sp. BK313 TaxID=2587081 RepID=UPI00105CDD36|nr:hypothetical protein [Rhizobium sp. BK313]MBB3453265.1 hypothetical protein [Rhizobium sp. BK313]